ncbi:MAG TPA: thioredoxin domain-containing protein [Phycisphaerae bacterium]|jgi:protein-disulfide isomerase|nr:thioredoxin domain-containing protein [Phycisphaerae bacterium]HOB76597.1 thioredoxin domain-containing protein [Phycisphaerae bacterium]HOJ54803.1 thioredoxin domain-containing protein [Phycisphaerae bacterium]HOL26919.1 thioredoxin domain-containing protein [Phycisphaerae bacterium]HPP20874.1 thioredoxin domain-containing protein [Phycisphaerae bacterium]
MIASRANAIKLALAVLFSLTGWVEVAWANDSVPADTAALFAPEPPAATRPAGTAASPEEEIAALRAELEEVKQVARELAARLKDYEDDYQAVWFNFMNEPVVDIPVDPSDSIRGKVDAPHTIVLYMDLQCPICKAADKLLQEKLRKYPGQLRLAVKHFPLNKTCNPTVAGNTHPAACAAAVTAEAARALGGEEAFWRMYDELFEHQREFAKNPKEVVKEACARIGINHDALWKKIHTRSIWNRIREQATLGGQIGVSSTPTIYYDGRKVAGWANSKFWDFIMFREQQASGVPATRPAATQPAGPGTRPQ